MRRIGDIDDLAKFLALVETVEVAGNQEELFETWGDMIGRALEHELIRHEGVWLGGLDLRLTKAGIRALSLLSDPTLINDAVWHCTNRRVDAELFLVLDLIEMHVRGQLYLDVKPAPKPEQRDQHYGALPEAGF